MALNSVAVIGVGNTLLGDDGIGYCIAKALKECARIGTGVYIEAVQNITPGHIDLLENIDYVIFIDAYMDSNMPKNTDIVLLELDPSRLTELDAAIIVEAIDPHNVNPLQLLVLAYSAGVFKGKGLLIGVKPDSIGFGKPLSTGVVRRGVKAVRMLADKVREMGVELDINYSCVEDWLYNKCGKPFLD